MHFYAFMARMKHIARWSLMRNTRTENVAEHTLQAAMIAHALCVLHNSSFACAASPAVNPERAATLALYHEAAEVITGDLPTPVKYYSPDLRAAYRAIEDMASRRLHAMLPASMKAPFDSLLLSPEREPEWPYVKAADRICAYLKCVEEERSGNQDFSRAKTAIERDIDRLPLPAAQEFMRLFAPSFSLTLDELN